MPKVNNPLRWFNLFPHVCVAALLTGCNPAEDAWQSAVLAQGKLEIGKRFTDPNTAVFKDVFYNSGRWVPVACGEVGGDGTGFQRFIATREEYTVLESDEFPHAIMPDFIKSFDDAWALACSRNE